MWEGRKEREREREWEESYEGGRRKEGEREEI